MCDTYTFADKWQARTMVYGDIQSTLKYARNFGTIRARGDIKRPNIEFGDIQSTTRTQPSIWDDSGPGLVF